MSATPQAEGPQNWLYAALGGAESSRARRAAKAITLSYAAYEVGSSLVNQVKRRFAYTVSITGTDEAYDEVHAWLVDQIPPRKLRSLVTRTTRRRANYDEWAPVPDDSSSRPESDKPLHIFYDGSKSQVVTISGHRVVVSIETDHGLRGTTIQIDPKKSLRPLEKLVFTCYGPKARDAVLEHLATFSVQVEEDTPPRLYIAERWGDWGRMSDVQPRSLDTVILERNQRERIVADLELFLASETDYHRIGMPWHRGYLFHGPPGTGKTSLAKALANHFHLDVYYVPLSDMREDTNLLTLLARIPPRTVLVLEDIDVVHATKSRDDAESGGISLSGLLNALDGLTTPNGMITIMTTNDISVLDPALIRVGRVDLSEELSYLDTDQAVRLIHKLTGQRPKIRGQGSHFRLASGIHVHADMIEVAKHHLHDADAMYAALLERFNAA